MVTGQEDRISRSVQWLKGMNDEVEFKSVPDGFWAVEIRFLDKLGTRYIVISSVATGDLLMKIPVTPSKGKAKHQRK